MNKTMLALILDRSGSMQSLRNDVIGGVNSFLKEQREIKGEAILTAVRFDNIIETFRPMKNLCEVTDIQLHEFEPRGSTSLLDAIGKTIDQLDHEWQIYQPDQAIVVIYTDGEENSSEKYDRAKIKGLIETRQKNNKWAFLFLGANLDSFAEASSLGIWNKGVSNFAATADGLASAYTSTSASIGLMRSVGNAQYFSDDKLASVADAVKKAEGKTSSTPTK